MHNRMTGKQQEIFIGIKKTLTDKYDSVPPKKLVFIATDEDLRCLKMYKQFLEWSLYNVDRALSLFESKED